MKGLLWSHYPELVSSLLLQKQSHFPSWPFWQISYAVLNRIWGFNSRVSNTIPNIICARDLQFFGISLLICVIKDRWPDIELQRVGYIFSLIKSLSKDDLCRFLFDL